LYQYFSIQFQKKLQSLALLKMFSNNMVRFIVLLTVLVLSAAAAHAQYYAISGVHTGVSPSGARPVRRNVLDMQNDTPTW
jgi:tyrosinase